LRRVYEKQLESIITEEANYQNEIDDLEEEKKALKIRLDDLDIKDLPTLQSRFLEIYGDGPPPAGNTKYSPAEIQLLEEKFIQIGKV